MKWTTDKPTTPGFYFWRGRVGDKPCMRVHEVELINNVLTVRVVGPVKDITEGEWAGPVTVPEEP